MPNSNSHDDAALRNAGQKLREGWIKNNPTPERSFETVRDAVRQEWEREQKINREKSLTKDIGKDQGKGPPEPGIDR